MLKQIKDLLPYTAPFLFVDEFLAITAEGASGKYTYRQDEYFYRGHFPGQPVTPGVILIETMAQIGLVGLGIFLTAAHENKTSMNFVFTSSEVEFLKMVRPGETVTVKSEKIYFRLRKLKCNVTMEDQSGEIVCRGTLAGMVVKA